MFYDSRHTCDALNTGLIFTQFVNLCPYIYYYIFGQSKKILKQQTRTINKLGAKDPNIGSRKRHSLCLCENISFFFFEIEMKSKLPKKTHTKATKHFELLYTQSVYVREIHIFF